MLCSGAILGGLMLTGSGALAGDEAESSSGPLSDVDTKLTEYGVTPHLFVEQFWLGNPSAGTSTNEQQKYTRFFAGADFDLDRMEVIPGGNIHFMYLWVPFRYNEDFDNSNGGVLAGDPVPWITSTRHLFRFTYEQKLFDDRLSIELGKSNPGSNFGSPNCNIWQACVNTILSKTMVFGPQHVASWGARLGYHFTPTLESNIGVWRTKQGVPSNEERWDEANFDESNNLLLVNVVRHVNWQQEIYPFNCEILIVHNFMEYEDLFYTVNGTSKVYDTSSPVSTHKGVSAIYLAAKKAIWRRDSGTALNVPAPSSVSLHSSVTQTLQSNAYNGISTLADAGLIWSGPWLGRPNDSYGLTFRWARLAEREQLYLQDMFDSLGGKGWKVPRNEYQLGVSASIMLTPEVNLQMTGSRIWNNTNWQNPNSNVKPENGYIFWITATVLVDKLLGLNDRQT